MGVGGEALRHLRGLESSDATRGLFSDYAEARPEAVALAKELRSQRMSLRKIAAELARCGYLTANGRQYVATAVQAMLAG